MATVFWDAKGVLFIEFLSDSVDPMTDKKYTISADRYFDTLLKLHAIIGRKGPGLFKRHPILLQDNARPHAAP